MRYNEIDRFSESHDATLANITAILYERLGCTKDASYDYILDKLREIKDFDSCKSELGFSLPPVYSYIWQLENGRKRRDNGTS